MTLVELLRHMQFFAHIAHNSVGGATFLQDHAFLAELYAAYEAAYDAVVERMIGLDEDLDLVEVHKVAVKDLKVPKSFEACFKEILSMEKELCDLIEKLVKNQSQGTVQLIGDLANQSEMRIFKLKQRLK